MRFFKILSVAAVAGLAGMAQAQDSAQPDESAPAEAAEGTRLPELDDTLRGLEDAPAQEEGQEQAPTEAEEAAQLAPAVPVLPTGPLTAEERASLQTSVERGQAIAGIAQAGLLGTQDMLTRIADPDAAGIAGWLVEPEGNGFAVTFYGDGADGPVAIYRSRVLGGRVVSRDVFAEDARPALSPTLARMAAARAAASALDHSPCGAEAFNTLVVPPADTRAPIHVYQITPAANRTEVPVGGHYRATVGPDGTVTEARAFAACQNVPLPQPGADGRPRPIPVAHLLDRVPTEVHVFLALWTGRPLIVATGEGESEEAGRVWLVTGEGIAELRR